MNDESGPTISQRNYRAVMFLFSSSSVILIGVLIFVFWMDPIVDIAILAIVAYLTVMLTFIMWYRRRYPPSARFD